jgi:hydroxymethylglutaryl-CoA lyase
MRMGLPKQVKIVEVSPRDGFQHESRFIPADIKVAFIDLLSETGLNVIECTSFVSPRWIPQLSDGHYVLTHIIQKSSVHYPVLIPNKIGFENALKAGAKEMAVFTAATETFCQKNTHCSLAESLDRCAEVITLAKKENIPVRAYISCVMGCPYEGAVDPHRIVDIAEKFLLWGCDEISLGDTIGTGTPRQAQQLVTLASKKIPVQKLAAHFHDTYGQALANLFAVLEKGISIIDSSVNGLGGCPYARGATGNAATEDVVYMLNGMGIETGINLDYLLKAGRFISHYLSHPPNSKLARIRLK